MYVVVYFEELDIEETLSLNQISNLILMMTDNVLCIRLVQKLFAVDENGATIKKGLIYDLLHLCCCVYAW